MRPLIITVFLVVLLLAPAVSANGQTGGSQVRYAAYSIQSINPNVNFIVNETIRPSSEQGYSILAVNVSGSSNHFYFSETVNSTFALLPYLPLINNETLSYGNNVISLSLSFNKSGTENVQFMGASWVLNVFALSVSVGSPNGTGQFVGSIATFPSRLVYSLSGSFNGTQKLTATLLSTNASLADPASPPNYTDVLIGTGLVAAALATFFFLYLKNRIRGSKVSPSTTPMYWVD